MAENLSWRRRKNIVKLISTSDLYNYSDCQYTHTAVQRQAHMFSNVNFGRREEKGDIATANNDKQTSILHNTIVEFY